LSPRLAATRPIEASPTGSKHVDRLLDVVRERALLGLGQCADIALGEFRQHRIRGGVGRIEIGAAAGQAAKSLLNSTMGRRRGDGP
jgi:hypothetical protein